MDNLPEREIQPQDKRHEFVPEIKAINEKERSVLHLISTGATDRANDIVEPSGAEVDNFLRNPVVLVDHDYRIEKIIGRAESVEITKEGIFARTKFADTPLARDAWELVKGKFARAWSIGFRPKQFEAIKEKGQFKGFHHKVWELLEYSLVAVPMNADVVTDAVQRGLLHTENIPLLVKTVEPAPAMPAAEEPKAPEAAPDMTEFVAAAVEADRLIRRQRMASVIEATLKGD
jgi:HK97 family phage prohead protease